MVEEGLALAIGRGKLCAKKSEQEIARGRNCVDSCQQWCCLEGPIQFLYWHNFLHPFQNCCYRAVFRIAVFSNLFRVLDLHCGTIFFEIVHSLPVTNDKINKHISRNVSIYYINTHAYTCTHTHVHLCNYKRTRRECSHTHTPLTSGNVAKLNTPIQHRNITNWSPTCLYPP